MQMSMFSSSLAICSLFSERVAMDTSDAGEGRVSPEADLGLVNLERVMGIEPTLAAWEAAVLPLNYTRARPESKPGPGRWQRREILHPANTRCRMLRALSSTGSSGRHALPEMRWP